MTNSKGATQMATTTKYPMTDQAKDIRNGVQARTNYNRMTGNPWHGFDMQLTDGFIRVAYEDLEAGPKVLRMTHNSVVLWDADFGGGVPVTVIIDAIVSAWKNLV